MTCCFEVNCISIAVIADIVIRSVRLGHCWRGLNDAWLGSLDCVVDTAFLDTAEALARALARAQWSATVARASLAAPRRGRAGSRRDVIDLSLVLPLPIAVDVLAFAAKTGGRFVNVGSAYLWRGA